MEPERTVHPASWLDHTPFAFWIVDALRPSVFVELGCHSGNSYASFAQAVQTLGLTTACYGVDTWRGDPHAGFFDEAVFEEWSAYHDRRFSAFSRLIRSTFDEALEHFADGSVDLIHLDGYHTFESVSHDFESWRPKLSSRSVVLCHDINVREADFGAWRLWERLRMEYPSFEFLHGHGLGVLGTGSDLPPAVDWLLSLRERDAERVNHVRLFFSRLGAAVAARFSAAESKEAARVELASRDAQLAAAAADVARLNAALADSTNRLSESAARLAESDASLAETEARLGHARAESNERASEVSALSGQLADARGNVERANRELLEARAQIGDANQRLAVAREDVGRLGERMITAERKLAKRTAQAQSLYRSVKASRAELKRRARQIDTFASKVVALYDRVHVLAADLDARDAQITRLNRDLAPVPSALRARAERNDALDANAAEALQELCLETACRRDETTRRTRLERLLARSQAQRPSARQRPVRLPHRSRGLIREHSSDSLGAYVRDPRIARLAASRARISTSSLEPPGAPTPTVVFVSHVSPWQPKAGNEYRVARMLRWYQRNGYRIVPIIAPLPGEELSRAGVEAIAGEFGNAVQCHRDGRIEYILRSAPDAL